MKDRASVVIIGGGIIGASVAYHLASEQSITDVVVLDKAKLGTGSTSASLGGFRHQFSNELSIKLTIESVKIIESFQDIFGYDPLVRRDGYVFIASKKDSLEKLEKNADMAKSLGVNVKILSKNELRERFPFYRFEGIEGGSFCQDDGHASTLAVFQGFVSRAKELGVHFVEFAEVQGFITGERSALGVKTNRGPVRADQIVIAAGAYSGAVGKLASAEIPIRPYPRKIFVTERFEDNIPESIPLIVDVDSTLAFGREGKSLIFSDNTHTSSTFEVNSFSPSYDEHVYSKVLERIPALSKASISYSVSGLYEMTPDAVPIVSGIKQLKGLYCCAGFAGHGFMHSPAIGKLMSEVLVGRKAHLDISDLDNDRFERPTSKEQLII